MPIAGYDMPGANLVDDDDGQDAYLAIKQDMDKAYEFFRPKQMSGLRNASYRANDQWDEQEKEAHRRQHRIPYVFNEVSRVVDSIVGTQNQTRLDSKILPREKGDEAPAELLSFLSKWVEQINDLEYTESEVFADALVKGYGVAGVRWENEDVQYGFPKIDKIPFNEIMWDPNSQTLDLSDARWMARYRVMTKLDAIEMMPFAEETIRDTAYTYDQSFYGEWKMETPKQKRMSYSNGGKMTSMEKRGMVPIVEHYEKVKTYIYNVADTIRDEVTPFNDYQEAQDYFDGLTSTYAESGENMFLPDGSPAIALQQDSVNSVLQSIIVGTEIVYRKMTALPDFPWVVCFSYFDDGDFWAFVDNLISRQDMLNRMISQLDYQLGASSKSAITVIDHMLKKGWSLSTLAQEYSKTAPIIPVLNHDAIRQIPNQPVNPEYFNISQFVITGINDSAGGRNVMGLQESAAESGRAVIARAEQAGVGRLPFFDKLRLWRKNITLRLVWYIKNYMSSEQIVRIIGADPDVAFTFLDDQVLESLREIAYDIQIDEATKSASVKASQYQQMKELFALIQAPAEVIAPVMIELSDIPMSKKTQLLEYMDFYKEYQMKKAEAAKQETMTQEVTDQMQRKQLRDTLEGTEEIQLAQHEAEKEKGNLQVKLDDIEKLRQKLAEQQSTPSESNQMNATLNTGAELGARPGAQMQGMMGVSGS